MGRKSALFLFTTLFAALLLTHEAGAQRSFVGKRLTGLTFTDTEGHVIDPTHYKDSILVMFSGIPW